MQVSCQLFFKKFSTRRREVPGRRFFLFRKECKRARQAAPYSLPFHLRFAHVKFGCGSAELEQVRLCAHLARTFKPLKYYIYISKPNFSATFFKKFSTNRREVPGRRFFFSKKDAKGHGRPRPDIKTFSLVAKKRFYQKKRPLRVERKAAPLREVLLRAYALRRAPPHKPANALADARLAYARWDRRATRCEAALRERSVRGGETAWSPPIARGLLKGVCSDVPRSRQQQGLQNFFSYKSRGRTYIM